MALSQATLKLGSTLFGTKTAARPETSNSVQGFGALPPQAQQAYLNQALPAAQGAFENINKQMPLARVQAPSDLFGNQSLYNLQQMSDQMGGLYGHAGQGVSPADVVPINAMQQEALSNIMNGADPNNLSAQLMQYQDPYNIMVRDRAINSIKDRADQIRKKIMGDMAASGNLAASGGSALAFQLSELDKNTSNQIADLEAFLGKEGYQQANNLRNQQLSQMLGGGELLQGQHQNELNASLGRQQLPYKNAGMLAQIINAASGGNSSSIKAREATTNGLGKAENLLSMIVGKDGMENAINSTFGKYLS